MTALVVGDRVRFQKAGRFPQILEGVIEWFHSDWVKTGTGWIDVRCDDGSMRRVRGKSLTKI